MAIWHHAGPNMPTRKLFLQAAALLLLQQLYTLGVPLAQSVHFVLLVHLVAAALQARPVLSTRNYRPKINLCLGAAFAFSLEEDEISHTGS